MIRLFFPMRKLPHLTLQEFQRHWTDVHIILNEPFRLIRGYIQYHTLENDPIREILPKAALSVLESYDGVPSAYYNTMEDMLTEHDPNLTSYTAPAIEDHNVFIDDDRSVACFTKEDPVIEPDGVNSLPFVLIGCLRRKRGMDTQEFQSAWREIKNIGHEAYTQGLIQGLIQNHALVENTGNMEGIGSEDEPWDGIETIYFQSVAGVKAFSESEVARKWYNAEKEFIDHKHSVYVLTERLVVKKFIR